MVRLHGSVKEMLVGINKSYVHPVEDQIIIKKFDTYMPTLLTKLLQLQCIVSLNENNLLHEEKVYERSPSSKMYESLGQVNSTLAAVKGKVLSGIQLINDENFCVFINRKNVEKIELLFIKIIFDNKREH